MRHVLRGIVLGLLLALMVYQPVWFLRLLGVFFVRRLMYIILRVQGLIKYRRLPKEEDIKSWNMDMEKCREQIVGYCTIKMNALTKLVKIITCPSELVFIVAFGPLLCTTFGVITNGCEYIVASKELFEVWYVYETVYGIKERIKL